MLQAATEMLPPRRVGLPLTWMPQQPQQLDLPQDACGIRDMIEYIVYFLNGDLLIGLGVHSRAHHAIAALANDFLQDISARSSAQKSPGVPMKPGAGCSQLLLLLGD